MVDLPQRYMAVIESHPSGGGDISVVITPDQINADEGSEVVLECRVLNGQADILWEKVDGPLRIDLPVNVPRLVIRNFRREDAGRYSCIPLDVPSQIPAFAEVIVNGTFLANLSLTTFYVFRRYDVRTAPLSREGFVMP